MADEITSQADGVSSKLNGTAHDASNSIFVDKSELLIAGFTLLTSTAIRPVIYKGWGINQITFWGALVLIVISFIVARFTDAYVDLLEERSKQRSNERK